MPDAALTPGQEAKQYLTNREAWYAHAAPAMAARLSALPDDEMRRMAKPLSGEYRRKIGAHMKPEQRDRLNRLLGLSTGTLPPRDQSGRRQW